MRDLSLSAQMPSAAQPARDAAVLAHRLPRLFGGSASTSRSSSAASAKLEPSAEKIAASAKLETSPEKIAQILPDRRETGAMRSGTQVQAGFQLSNSLTKSCSMTKPSLYAKCPAIFLHEVLTAPLEPGFRRGVS